MSDEEITDEEVLADEQRAYLDWEDAVADGEPWAIPDAPELWKLEE